MNNRALFLADLIRKRYIFRPEWPLLAYRMLGWGLSAALILHILETRYVRS